MTVEDLRTKRSKGVNYTTAVRREHRALAVQLLGQPLGMPPAVAKQLREKFRIGPKHAARVVEEALEEMARYVDPKRVPKLRAQAVARVRNQLHRLAYARTKDKKTGEVAWVERPDPNYAAIARFEQLLMQLEGTQQTVKLDVDLRMNEAATEALAKLSPDQVRTIMERRARNLALADLARTMLPEHASAIDVEGSSVEEDDS